MGAAGSPLEFQPVGGVAEGLARTLEGDVRVDPDVHGGDVGLVDGEHRLRLGTALSRPVQVDHNNGNIIGRGGEGGRAGEDKDVYVYSGCMGWQI